MGTLFSTLDIARSGLQAAQVQMDVAGHNISNVNKEGYSRQRVTLVSPDPLTRPYGQLGRGVQVSDIERVREDFLDTVYRQQTQDLGSANVRASYFSRIEDLFQEPGTNGFGTRLSEFFNSLDDFANNVEEQPVRMSALTEAQSLATGLNQVAQQVYTLRTNANEEVRNAVPDLNSLGSRISALNVNIRAEEVTGKKANDLRDERDLLLDQLSQQVNISYRERSDGQVDVFIGGDVFVNGDSFRALSAVRDTTLDPQRPDFVQVRFADNNQAADITGGEVYGAMQARDSDLAQVGGHLDVLASTIIREINHVQSTGAGLDRLSGTIDAANRVTDATAPLASAGLPFDVTPGSFDVIVYDAAGAATRTTVNVAAGTTLQSLAADLSAIPNFSASAGADGTLHLGTSGSYTFSFANDTAGALTALGVNSLFTGSTAATIGVNQALINNPRLLTSGYSTDVSNTGDNTAALAMANIRTQRVLDNGTATINDYYESTVVRVGVDARANSQNLDVLKSFTDDFQARRQEVSGVSIDEEVTSMIQYQRGYEAAARVITVVDRMLDALLAAGA